MAIVQIAVDLIEPRADQAFDVANAAVTQFRNAVRTHGIPDNKVSGSRLRLQSVHEGYGANRAFVGYQCVAAFEIETEDLNGLQQLLLDAVQAGASRVDGVHFDVHDKQRMRD